MQAVVPFGFRRCAQVDVDAVPILCPQQHVLQAGFGAAAERHAFTASLQAAHATFGASAAPSTAGRRRLTQPGVSYAATTVSSAGGGRPWMPPSCGPRL